MSAKKLPDLGVSKSQKGSLPSTSRGSSGKLRQSFLNRTDPLARILDLADDAIISVHQDQLIVLFNHGAEKMFGYSAREVEFQPLGILLPHCFPQVQAEHIGSSEHTPFAPHGQGERRQILGRRKDGSEFSAEASVSKIGVDGDALFTVIMRDVTQRVLAEERLRASLREKEVLLTEVHHRVKNNLQVVSSLLGLQSRLITDPVTRKQFEESQYRIQSMALLHETLYQSDNLASIDFSDYLRRLLDQLYRSYRTSASIDLRVALQALHMHVDVAVPCGLIVNELISNALKYAFPGAGAGEIRVKLSEVGPEEAELVVADDGVGLPPDVDWLSARTLGLRLVRTLTEQIRGTVTLDCTGGTRFQIRFPRYYPNLSTSDRHA